MLSRANKLLLISCIQLVTRLHTDWLISPSHSVIITRRIVFIVSNWKSLCSLTHG